MKHLGDITKILGFSVPITDCVIGGSPCQDLSVAGRREVLEVHEIYTEYDVCVNNIINRMGMGTCPMEDVVGTLNSPLDALNKIRQRLIELNLHG